MEGEGAHCAWSSSTLFRYGVPLSQLSGQVEHPDLLILGSSCILQFPFTWRRQIIKWGSLPWDRKY